MPSTTSRSVSSDLLSSTVMTPSRPTLSMASAIRRPTSGSLALMAATSATALLSSMLRAMPCTLSTAATTALSIPRFRASGLAPAATLRRPSRTMAWPRTVAVVVPSPVMSFVLLAISISSLAPMFSRLSDSSTSLATVTPSLVMVGEPNFFSSTTLRPRGPRVTFTALATEFTPRSSPRRASSWKVRSLAMCISYVPSGLLVSVGRLSRVSVDDDGVDVTQAQDHEFPAFGAEFGAAVLGEQNRVTFADVHRFALTVVEELARAGGQDLAPLTFLLGGVGQHEAAGRRLRFFDDLYDHLVRKWPEPEITVSHSCPPFEQGFLQNLSSH